MTIQEGMEQLKSGAATRMFLPSMPNSFFTLAEVLDVDDQNKPFFKTGFQLNHKGIAALPKFYEDLSSLKPELYHSQEWQVIR